MQSLLAVSLLLLLSTAAMAATPPVSFAALLARPAAAPTKRIPYGDAPDQFGELWLPATKGPYPVVIMIHGGCWLAALPGVALMAQVAEDLRRHGVAVWNLEYRRIGADGGGYPGTFSDIAQGTDHLRKIAAENNLDLSHIVAMGHSAGGHLALWDAARLKLPKESPLYDAEPLKIGAVVTLAGINDLSAYRDTGPDACGGPATIDSLVGAATRTGNDIYADTSPAALLPLGVRQFVTSGARDPIVPSNFATDYATKAKAAGDDVTAQDFADAGHFELIDPTSSAWSEIRAWIMGRLK